MLEKLRKQIDQVDYDLIKLFKRRQNLVQRIGLYKKKHKLEIFSRKRENQIAKKLNNYAKKFGLRKVFLYRIWDNLLIEAKELQKKIKK